MQPMIHELESPASIAAQHANMVAYWSSFGAAPGRELHSGPDLVRMVTMIRNPQLNGVFRSRLGVDADDVIAATRDYFTAKRVPMLWWVEPGTQPADLGERLQRSGFAPAGDVPLMAIDLDRLDAEQSLPPQVTISEIASEAELRDWGQIISHCFDLPESEQDSFTALERSLDLASNGTRLRFLATLDGQPAATSMLFPAEGVAGIYVVATLRAARGRGLGAAVTLAALHRGRALGYRIGTLQASTMGEPVYRRIGFEQVAAFQLYAWAGDQPQPQP